MVANEKSFKQFLETRDIHFTIPVYQRPYSWQEEQCQQLLDDLKRIASDNAVQKHFIGSVVYVLQGQSIGSRNNHYVVVDGQQRITTLSLLLLALAHQYATNGMPGEQERILRYFIINEYAAADAEDLVKLKPLNMDKAAYRAIVAFVKDGEAIGPNIETHLMVKNFRYFVKQFSQEQIPALYQGFETLEFVSIQLETGKDDPQKIFESLNSTGLGLSQSDLIRNYLLMNLEVEKQTDYYRKYWEPIENKLSVEHIPSFFRDYITMKHYNIPKENHVYREFKLRTRLMDANNHVDLEKLKNQLVELKEHAEVYQWIIQPTKAPSPAVKHELDLLNSIPVTPIRPFVLELLMDWKHEIVDESAVLACLQLLQSYIMRRYILDLPSNALNKVFTGLYHRLDKSALLADFQQELLSKSAKHRFPSDEEVEIKLKTREIYGSKKDFRDFLFQQMENVDTKAKVDITQLSIEHVMPQKLTEEWRKALGPEFDRIHKTHIHTLANLTLTEHNSAMANKSYSAKMDTLHNQSRLWFNQYFKYKPEWNEAAIIERQAILFQRFIQVWAFPVGNRPKIRTFLNENNESKAFALHELGDVKGLKLKSATLNNIDIDINEWSKLIVLIVQTSFREDSDKANIVLKGQSFIRYAREIDAGMDRLYRFKQINDKLWIDTTCNSNTKLKFIRYWAKSFGWVETLLLRFELQ